MINHKIRTTLVSLLGVAALAACSSSADDATTSADGGEIAAPADSTSTDGAETVTTGDDDASAASSTAATTATGLDAGDELLAVAAGAGEWSESDETAITLANGASTADSDDVLIDGDTVTITAAGTYRIAGTLDEGQLVVDTGDEGVVRVVLDGVDVASSTASALVVTNAEAVIVWLADGSTNHLADTGSATASASTEADEEASDDGADEDAEDTPNATLYSADDLVIAGTGALTVDGSSNDAITSKDGLVIVDGTITVTATDDGIRGKDFLVIQGGAITTNVDGDGLTSDDTTTDDSGETVGVGSIWIAGGHVDVTAATDGIDAEADVTIDGGTIEIAAGDDAVHAEAALTVNDGAITITESYEGLEGAAITIAGGDITIRSTDDGINVADGSGAAAGGPGGGFGGGPGAQAGQAGGQMAGAGSLSATISGGTIVVNADGDGIDVNGSLAITGGTIVVNGPTQNMNGALDVDGSFVVSDATLVAAGSAGMAMAPSAEDQGVISVRFQSALPSGSVVVITDTDGALVAAFETSKATQSLVVTSHNVESGATYTVSTGGTVEGTTVGGYVVDGTVDGGSSTATVTAT